MIPSVVDLLAGRGKLDILHRHIEDFHHIRCAIAADRLLLQGLTQRNLKGNSLKGFPAEYRHHILTMIQATSSFLPKYRPVMDRFPCFTQKPF